MSRVRKEPIEEMRQKKREEQRQNSQNERFRIVNCSRTIAEANGPERVEGDAGQEITILDIEKHSTEARLTTETATRGGVETASQLQPGQSTEQTAGSSHGGDYVYDLYVPDVGQPELEWSEQFLENMLRFVPLEEINLIFSYTYF